MPSDSKFEPHLQWIESEVSTKIKQTSEESTPVELDPEKVLNKSLKDWMICLICSNVAWDPKVCSDANCDRKFCSKCID